MIQGGWRLQESKNELPVDTVWLSIITVVFNGAKHLEQTIQSVLTQLEPDAEYIIIDGGSTDGTLDIIRTYDSKLAYWCSETDGGIYDAMNKGISWAKGSWIGIINSDDYYTPNAFRFLKQAIHEHPADIYHGNMEYVSALGTTISTGKPDIQKMKEMPAVFHPTCFVKSAVYHKIGMFDTRYKISSDYDFLLRCLDSNYLFYAIPQTLTCFRLGGMSASCASNLEGYRIMKEHKTGHHRKIIFRTLICYLKTFLKKIIHLNGTT